MGFMNPLTSYPLLDGRGWPRFRRPFHLFFSLFFLALHLVDIILVPLLHQPTRWSLFRVRCVSSFLPLLTRQKKRRRRRREKEPPEKEMNILLTYNRSSTERNQLRKNGRDGQESGTRSISQNNLHSTQSPVLYDVHQAIGRSYERSEGSEKKKKKMPFYYYIVSLSFGQLDQSSVAFTCVAVYRG